MCSVALYLRGENMNRKHLCAVQSFNMAFDQLNIERYRQCCNKNKPDSQPICLLVSFLGLFDFRQSYLPNLKVEKTLLFIEICMFLLYAVHQSLRQFTAQDWFQATDFTHFTHLQHKWSCINFWQSSIVYNDQLQSYLSIAVAELLIWASCYLKYIVDFLGEHGIFCGFYATKWINAWSYMS